MQYSAPLQQAGMLTSKKASWWHSLRTKIVAWSFVPAAIILSAAAWLAFFSYQKVLGDLAIKQDWAIVQADAVQLNLAIANLVNPIVLPVILDIDIVKEAPVETRAQNILDQAKYLDAFDGGIYFLDRQGKVFRAHPEAPGLVGLDWSGTPAMGFIQAHPGRAAFTDLGLAGPGGKEILCLAQSMNGLQAEFIGAYYFCFSIESSQDNFYTVLSRLDLGPDVVVIDGNQRVIFSPDPAALGKDLSREAYLQQVLQSESLSTRYRKGTDDMLVSYNPVDGTVNDRNGWKIVKAQPWAEIMKPSLPYRRLLLVLLALGVIVPVGVTAYGVRHITNPIRQLIQAAARVTAGQLEQRIEVRTGDEIETLAGQFNAMSAELAGSYASLEKRVAGRTRELAVLNSIISVAGQSLNAEEILAGALDHTVARMGFEAGAAFRLEAEPAPPSLAASRGLEPEAALELAGRCAARLPAEASQEALEEPDGDRLLVCAPLRAKSRSLGFFLLVKRGPGRLSPEELALLSSAGQQVGVALENAHLYEQAEEAAAAAERHRLARELHDAVTQTLFSASLIADVLPRVWDRSPEEGRQNLEELRRLNRGALAEMRTLLLEMRPEYLARADLKSLLTQLADAFIGRLPIPISVAIQEDCEQALEVKLVFYRVAQEALNNIVKHSGARQVDLRLECRPGRMRLEIIDDGLGFDAGAIAPGHLGIGMMRERADSIGASLQVESQAGQGTRVELSWNPPREEGLHEYDSNDPGNVGG